MADEVNEFRRGVGVMASGCEGCSSLLGSAEGEPSTGSPTGALDDLLNDERSRGTFIKCAQILSHQDLITQMFFACIKLITKSANSQIQQAH